MINFFSCNFKIIKVWEIRVLFFSFLLVFPGYLSAQEDNVNYVDTLPFLNCKVVIEYEQTISHYIGTRSGIEENLTVYFTDCPGDDNIAGRIEINDLNTSFDDPQGTLESINFRPQNEHLYLFFNDTISPLLDFVVSNESLVFAPEFVGQLEHSFDFPSEYEFKKKVNEVKRWDTFNQTYYFYGDTVTEFDDLYYILSNMTFTDMHPLRVLELIKSRQLMEAGEWDQAEANIQWLARSAEEDSDNYVTIRCEKVLNEIASYKKATVPFDLTDARKIGMLADIPVYPPGDNPTVFWQNTLLCVTQPDTSEKPGKMRKYDPVKKKWGKVLPAKYPDCSLEGFYIVYPCYYCDDSIRYWNSYLDFPGEAGSCELCDCFTDPRPLVSIPSESTFIFKGGYDSLAIARSGGSCIAGKGRYFFNDNKVCLYNSKISWNVLPEETISWYSNIAEDCIYSYYPAVVSPDQNWVAYSLRADDEGKIELWVARLKYHDKQMEDSHFK